MTSFTKVPISSLPLPPKSHVLPLNLTPDPQTPSPSEFRKVQLERPSVQRRARLLAPPAHFSYVSPCPIGFPYKITPDENEEVKPEDQANAVETWLIQREAIHEQPCAPSPIPGVLKKYLPKEKKRDQPLELIGLSEMGLKDCLPHLNVGDAFETLGSPTLSKASDRGLDRPAASQEENAARQELVDILSGHATLMNVDDAAEVPWAPWSLRYSGHQFGTWAGQLGDGRAISILATPHPEDPGLIYELQLKGAGRTPFSRTADGLAVVRSSIREFLCAEAMHALGIPTTRSLAMVSLPATNVIRERTESACVVTRVAPSFIRIGSFEALNPAANMFFFGGGQQQGHWDALRILGEWVAKRVLKLSDIGGEEVGGAQAWGKKLVLEVARRNAKMVAAWQAYGFMHGVINTDNVSILGLTIDYGPYAFMDVFDQYHICNHSDDEGRYAYNNQPSMIIYALRALLTALSPLIGAEAELGGKAVSNGWAEDASEDKIKEWREKGIQLVKEEMEVLIQETSAAEYGRLMRKRLALRRNEKDDEAKLSRPLLALLGDHKLDFHATFRKLPSFTPNLLDESNSDALNSFISDILAYCPEPDLIDPIKAKSDWKSWFKTYAERIRSEREEWLSQEQRTTLSDDEKDQIVNAERLKAGSSANPRFVLRQWVLEDVIAAVEKDPASGKKILRKTLHMACNPFESWGAEDDTADDESSLDPEVLAERKYCGIGDRRLLGFQCSCSS